MRRMLLAMVIFGVATGDAFAQSNVTLYGNVSDGIGFVNNVGGGKRYMADDGNFIPNLFGVTGTEDLGGSLHAVFKLASVFSLGTGALIVPDQLFKFESYVGLRSDTYGKLTFGNQTTFNFDLLGPISNQWAAGTFFAAHPGNIDELANTFQFQNAIKYTSIDYKGLSFGAMLGLGNQAGNFAKGRNYGFGLHYVNGPVVLAATYSSENNRFLEGASYVGLPELLGTPVTPDIALVADNVKNIGVGGSYQLGQVRLRALFTQSRLSGGGESENVNSLDLGANWQVTTANSINCGVGVSRLAGGQWITFVLNDVYSLSKSTSLYATMDYQRASGPGAVASLTGAGQASGPNQFGMAVGIQHFF